MTDRPILFSAPMILALLDGRKSQTRRLAWQKPQVAIQVGDGPVEPVLVPTLWQKAKPGDRLWVRETYARRADGLIAYRAGPHPWDVKHDICRWRPSIHMFRWASRLTLVVTEVRVQRLQDISHNDVTAEGASNVVDHENWWPRRWDILHGAGAWDENPEVVALTFTVHQCNIDSMGEAV